MSNLPKYLVLNLTLLCIFREIKRRHLRCFISKRYFFMIYRCSGWNKVNKCKKQLGVSKHIVAKNLWWCGGSDAVTSSHAASYHQFTGRNLGQNDCWKSLLCDALMRLQLLIWGHISLIIQHKSDTRCSKVVATIIANAAS